jgi:hypothetical protein
MSDATVAKFACDGCGKQYTWKPELAGKKAKCKCGAVMMIPADAPMAPEADGLYDLAPDSAPKPKAKPKAPMAPLAPRNAGGGRSESLRPAMAAAAHGGGGGGGGPIPAGVGYAPGPTQREKDRFSKDTLFDQNRDLYVPIGIMVAGFILFIVGYSVRYHVYGAGIAGIAIGAGILTLISAVLLIGMALVIAGPMGVSFGGPASASLKLAAIAIFTDGVLTWLDIGILKLAGQGGVMYGAIFQFFAAAGIFWLLLMYLFSMESEDSWLVVCILSFFYVAARFVIILLLAAAVGLGAMGGGGSGGGGGGVRAADADMEEELDAHRAANALPEAREYIAGGRQGVLKDHVDNFYDAGAKNVWFECDRDINGKLTPDRLVIEMPKDKNKRAAVLQKIADYHKAFDPNSSGKPDADDGRTYIIESIP